MMRSRRTALLALALAATGAAAPPAQAATPAVQVTVNARAGLATVGDAAVGVNHAVWDSQLGSDEVSGLLKDAGVQIMRYPGGSYADTYHWKDNTAPGGYVAPNTDFDTFMGGVRKVGGQALVIANYGTGTPEEAAAWVKYANVDHGDGVKYWEIGNEIYGNGHYGANWEADNHPAKTPAEYAEGVKAYAKAMKAVDPTIKIGVVLTTPGNWPDGVVADGDAGSWNQVVLSIAGPSVDFAILHWYPGGSNGPEALGKNLQVPDITTLARQQIDKYAGKHLDIAVTEMNTGYGENTQPGALFAADAYSSLLENGVFNVDWWDVHNGIGTTSTIAGQQDYGDWGLLSSGSCNDDKSICEPANNTPFPPYHAIALTSQLAQPGAQYVRASSSDSLVRVHAARQPNGDLAVLVANEDPDNARTVALSYAGYTPAATGTVHTYATGDAAVSTSTGAADSLAVPAYSVTTLMLHPSSATTGPAAVGQPTASDVTAHDATISWPAAAGGAKYEVWRQLGDRSEQWGETAGTGFTMHNLTPGTSYTVNVLTRDDAGKVSWASSPVTFTTAAAGTSTCAVKVTDTSDWGNGYSASVDITNTGTSPIAGWTLRFTWPRAWEKFDSGWNGTWAQSGNDVSVTGADFVASIAPGATVNIGYVGDYSGPNVLPSQFTLNGQVCTTP